ncbi:MAG: PilT/PilU family type 4a pilus ATPase [Planctomycetota bacterium]|nr:PilT/PilU family type 4a pilus ATPase [Planctomycetota bacterium]
MVTEIGPGAGEATGVPGAAGAPVGATDVSADMVEAPRHLKDIEKLFYAMGKNKASDLHLKSGLRPILRIATILHEVGNKVLRADDVKRMSYEIISEKQKGQFEENKGLDFAYSLDDGSRFRVNIFMDRGTVALAARRVNPSIPNFDQLHLPPTIKRIAQVTQGLVIMAGPTGQGKSTTLASIIQWINENRRVHIITIEDPVEYLFKDAKSFVNQREIGIDVEDWHMALKHIVRQNPDVILVGEMRDHISFDAALMAAETGHLVFGTIHASSAGQTIGRILDLFPPTRHDQIRMLLAFNLKAIGCQKLLPSCKEGIRMVPAVEILLVNPTVNKLIMNKEDKKIQDVIRGGAEEGMQDFNQSMVKLINAGLVSKKVALQFSPNPEQLKMNLQGIFLGEDHKIIG